MVSVYVVKVEFIDGDGDVASICLHRQVAMKIGDALSEYFANNDILATITVEQLPLEMAPPSVDNDTLVDLTCCASIRMGVEETDMMAQLTSIADILETLPFTYSKEVGELQGKAQSAGEIM